MNVANYFPITNKICQCELKSTTVLFNLWWGENLQQCFACRQQPIENFQIPMYFHVFVPLSIMSSSGILVVLPASLHFCSFILYSFFIYKGPIFSKRVFSYGKKGAVKKIFWGLYRLIPFPSLSLGPWPPEISPARTATDYTLFYIRIGVTGI